MHLTVAVDALLRSDSELVQARVPRHAACALIARHAKTKHTSARQVTSRRVDVKTGIVQFSWQIANRAWQGAWRVSVNCRRGGGHGNVSASNTITVSAGKAAPAASSPKGRIAHRIKTSVIHSATGGPRRAGADCPPVGAVLIAATDWMQSRGGGVDVLSNGPLCTSLDAPNQCVDLINRLITTKGWSNAIGGDAWTFWDHASTADFDKHANGSGYVPVPGDIVVWHGTGSIGQYGHVQVVDSVDGSTVHVVQQNSSTARRDLQIDGTGAITSRSWTGNTETVTGFLHAKRNVPPTPTPTGFAETAGSNANTWTNYTNAGGNQGPTTAAFQTIVIACKLTGFQVSDGNTWWYRIAQDPWSNVYYVSADAFYNNGATSGDLHGTPFVDPNVANC